MASSEVSTLPIVIIYFYGCVPDINLTHCYHIFLLLCAWDVSYTTFCHLLHIHSRKAGILFLMFPQV